jgi:PII-like signaling protein
VNDPRQGLMLRVFVRESARCGRRACFEAVLDEARAMGIAGASVFKGIAHHRARNAGRTGLAKASTTAG